MVNSSKHEKMVGFHESSLPQKNAASRGMNKSNGKPGFRMGDLMNIRGWDYGIIPGKYHIV